MKLFVISSDRYSRSEPKVVKQMFELGLETFILRKTRYTSDQLAKYLLSFSPELRKRIVIHKDMSLVRKFGLGGIHLSRTQRYQKWLTSFKLGYTRLKEPNIGLYTSFTKLSSLYEEHAEYSYVFLSSIFDSESAGRNYQSAFHESSLTSAIKRSKHKVVAYGGVNLENIERVEQLGFSGAAVKGFIWKSEAPLETYVQLKEKAATASDEQEEIPCNWMVNV